MSQNSTHKTYQFESFRLEAEARRVWCDDKPVKLPSRTFDVLLYLVKRPGTGEWFVQRSEDNSYFSFPWGQSGDIPVAADYDGDGRADIAVNRNGSEWWIWQSNTNSYILNHFGMANDLPVPSAFVR